MKIIANITLVNRDKEGKAIETPPNKALEVSDEEGEQLIARGFARHAKPVEEKPGNEPVVKTDSKVKVTKQ